MNKDEIKAKYDEVGGVLQKSLDEAKSVHLSGDEEQGELKDIIATLEEINDNFQKEIAKLQSSSEWDKFCIAFFGETNAGKSTIIESLRIIYDEETRQIEMMKQKQDGVALLSKHTDNYNALLNELKELNRYIDEKEKKFPLVNTLKSIGFVVLGFAIAFVLSIAGLI